MEIGFVPLCLTFWYSWLNWFGVALGAHLALRNNFSSLSPSLTVHRFCQELDVIFIKSKVHQQIVEIFRESTKIRIHTPINMYFKFQPIVNFLRPSLSR